MRTSPTQGHGFGCLNHFRDTSPSLNVDLLLFWFSVGSTESSRLLTPPLPPASGEHLRPFSLRCLFFSRALPHGLFSPATTSSLYDCPCDQNSSNQESVGGAYVDCSVADDGSADKCSKTALFKKEKLFFLFLFGKLLCLWSRKDSTPPPPNPLSPVELAGTNCGRVEL